MIKNLELQADVSEWISEDPQRTSRANAALRNWINYERRIAARYSQQTNQIFESSQRRSQELRSQGVSPQEAVKRLTSLLEKGNPSKNG